MAKSPNKVETLTPPTIGHTLLQLEQYLEQLVDVHELQRGDILALVDVWCQVHRPGCIEVYTADGSSPTLQYGPKR